MRCKDWDEGWCYKEDTVYQSGCVGSDLCTYKQMTSRIDIIGSNGGDGSHYLVERVARAIAGPDADQKLSGKRSGTRRWELHIKAAMRVIEVIENED